MLCVKLHNCLIFTFYVACKIDIINCETIQMILTCSVFVLA